MWKALKTCFIIERSNRSNIFTLLFMTLLIVGFMYIASDEFYNNPIFEGTNEYQSASAAVSKFQVVDLNQVENADSLFGYLTKLRQSIALKLAALKTERQDMLYAAQDQIYKQRNKLYEKDDFAKIEDQIPASIYNERELVYVNALQEKEIPFQQNALEYWPFLLSIFSMIGFLWFPFLSFYTSGIMIEDFRHTTLLKGYPVRFDQYVIAKSVMKFMMILSFIALIFIVSLPLIKYKGLGESAYPVVIYNGSVVAYTIPQYILLSIAMMIVVTLFTLLLSIIMNMLFKNMYLTLFIQLILYFVPIMFPVMFSWLPYNPFNYLNFSMVIEGGQLALKNPVDVTFMTGFILLAICIIIMLIVVQRFLSAGRLKRG
jgi:hypothetical protein